ncbi:MAG: hypothetical protein QXX87_00605 [Candidatus Jordarchaeales archaeon]
MLMFKKVLLKHGFRRNRRSDELQYITHWDNVGGIYVTIKPKMAIVEIRDMNTIHVFKSAKELDTFIRNLKESSMPFM